MGASRWQDNRVGEAGDKPTDSHCSLANFTLPGLARPLHFTRLLKDGVSRACTVLPRMGRKEVHYLFVGAGTQTTRNPV
jgi:hypothetical protein